MISCTAEAMKRCPECRRDYYDDTLLYCLEDGNALVQGSVQSPDGEPETAILSVPPAVAGGSFSDEGQTRPLIHTTAAEAEPRESSGGLSERQSLSAHRAAKPLIAVLAAVVLLVGGFFAYRYLSPAKQISSIAVMPFENRNSDADTDYLSDGLAESVIFRLTQIPDLRVSPTSSVMRYKGKETDIAKIASELGVDAVMTGRLTKRGDNLNITVELVDARTNKSLWGEQYERKLSELLTTQREIVSEIVGKLQLKLSGESEQKLAKKYTDNNEAYQLYLQGRFHWNKRNADDFQKAREYFQQAIAADPNYALAYTGLADTLALLPNAGNFRPSEYMPLAKQAVQKALEIDPNLAEAHASLGQILTFDYDFKGAERELKRAIELDPKYPSAHQWLAEVYTCQGNYDQALAEVNKALELDPLAMIINNAKGNVLRHEGKTDEAIAWFKKTVELFPDALTPRSNLASLYEEKGMYQEGIEQRLIVLKRGGADPDRVKNLELAFEKDGYKGFLKKQLERQLETQRAALEKDKDAYLSSYGIAGNYARLKDKDKTLEYLNKAYGQRQPQIVAIKTHPTFAFLRDDPRFKDLLKRMNLTE